MGLEDIQKIVENCGHIFLVFCAGVCWIAAEFQVQPHWDYDAFGRADLLAALPEGKRGS